ncbi:MAG: ParB N-terminal domain-containing protein [Oscillospiraceae bacterium]|nr:ParB N-terminal domain-containing protein [Oscillospiraceae bacterium]
MSIIKKTGVIQEWDFSDKNDKKDKPVKAATKEVLVKEWDFSGDKCEEITEEPDFELGANEILVKEWDFSGDKIEEITEKPDFELGENEILVKEWDFSGDKCEEITEEPDFELGENEILVKEWNFSGDKIEEIIYPQDSNINTAPNTESLILDPKVKYSEKIEYLNLFKLTNIDSSINFFPHPFDDGFYNLMESLETYGVITPLMVIEKEDSDMYTVVTGRSRLEALTRLYKQSSDKKYLNVPCIILDPHTDPEILQSIVISTNLIYRKVPKDIQIKAVFLLDKILTNMKTNKKQMNVTDIIAKRAGISRTTANTLRGFRNLSPKALELLFEDLLTREAARILSMIKSHDEQDMIINKLGHQINDLSKLRALIEKPSKKAKDIDVKVASSEPSLPLENKIEKELKKVPETTTIVLKVNCKELEETLKALASLRGKVAIKYQTIKDGDINNYFQVTLNDNHREQYLRNGFITQETVDLVRSWDYKEITKLV